MVEPSFEVIWQKILNQLNPGGSIRNWTALKGYIGDDMKVVKVTDDKIVIETPEAKHHQAVPKEDFHTVWKIWPAYKNGNISRRELCDLTFCSKYILSIFHMIEQK